MQGSRYIGCFMFKLNVARIRGAREPFERVYEPGAFAKR